MEPRAARAPPPPSSATTWACRCARGCCSSTTPWWERVYNSHRLTLHALSEMLAAAGLEHPDQVKPHHLARRVSVTEIKLFSELHTFLEPGVLLDGSLQSGTYADS